MKFDQLLELLRQHKAEISRFGVRSLAVFGSVARGEERPDSDIDFVVDFVEPATFDRYMNLKFFLEDLLKRRVDLVTQQAIRPELRPSIEQDARRVA